LVNQSTLVESFLIDHFGL